MRNILHSKPRVTRFTIDWDDPPLVDSENIAPTAPNIQQEQSTSLSNGAKDHMMKTGDYAAGPNNTDSNSSIPDYVQDMECHWDTCKTSSVNCETNQKFLWHGTFSSCHVGSLVNDANEFRPSRRIHGHRSLVNWRETFAHCYSGQRTLQGVDCWNVLLVILLAACMTIPAI